MEGNAKDHLVPATPLWAGISFTRLRASLSNLQGYTQVNKTFYCTGTPLLPREQNQKEAFKIFYNFITMHGDKAGLMWLCDKMKVSNSFTFSAIAALIYVHVSSWVEMV